MQNKNVVAVPSYNTDYFCLMTSQRWQTAINRHKDASSLELNRVLLISRKALETSTSLLPQSELLGINTALSDREQCLFMADTIVDRHMWYNLSFLRPYYLICPELPLFPINYSCLVFIINILLRPASHFLAVCKLEISWRSLFDITRLRS